MEELKAEKMKELLIRGLEIAYGTPEENRVASGDYKIIIEDFIYDGNTYRVSWYNEPRINNGIPYIQVIYHAGENRWDNWTHHLSKSLDFSIFEV